MDAKCYREKWPCLIVPERSAWDVRIPPMRLIPDPEAPPESPIERRLRQWRIAHPGQTPTDAQIRKWLAAHPGAI